MKKLYFLFLSISVLLTSCQFSENIYINDDGSGKMSLVFDGSDLMKMSGDSTQISEKPIDSIIVFKEFLKEKKDSIAQLSFEEQESLKSLEGFTMHTKIDSENQEMTVDMFTDFKNVEELQNAMAAMSKANSLGKKEDEDNPFSSFGNSAATEMEYSFNKGVFKRKATLVNKELHQQVLDSIGEAEMMFASSSYVLNYHFPRPIKSVSNENALFSADKKSFKLEISFLEYIKNPEVLNLEVELEKK